jgi:hypothetical protein
LTKSSICALIDVKVNSQLYCMRCINFLAVESPSNFARDASGSDLGLYGGIDTFPPLQQL